LTNDIIELGKDPPAVKNTNSKNQTTKKIKARSRSNSSTRSTEILDNLLEPATAILQNKDSPINLISFKYILENFTNKNLNIHDLCINVGSNASEVLDMAEKVLPLMVEKKIKNKISKLTRILFQSIPPSVKSTPQTSNLNQSNQ